MAESEGPPSLVWVGPMHSGSLCHSDGPSLLLLLDNLCLFACVTSMADTLLCIRLLSAVYNMCRGRVGVWGWFCCLLVTPGRGQKWVVWPQFRTVPCQLSLDSEGTWPLLSLILASAVIPGHQEKSHPHSVPCKFFLLMAHNHLVWFMGLFPH